MSTAPPLGKGLWRLAEPCRSPCDISDPLHSIRLFRTRSGRLPDSRRRNCRGTLLSRRSDHGSALVRLYTPRERGVGPVADIECAIAPGNPSVGGRFLFSHHASNGGLPMMKTKLAIMALAIAGLVGSTFTADAKSHKTHKSSMTTGANMKPNAKGVAANPSGQGNVGPGTNNNNGPAPGGK